MSQGENGLDTVTRLIWLEPQKDLDALERGVAAALPGRDSQLWGPSDLATAKEIMYLGWRAAWLVGQACSRLRPLG